VLFFLKLGSRRINIAGITQHPDEEWMQQVGRAATQEFWGYLNGCRYLLHDRDTKFCDSFRSTMRQSGLKPIMLPASSPNLNAFAERWVRSVRQECLSKLVLCSERSLMRVLTEFTAHYNAERNHRGRATRFCFPKGQVEMATSD